MQKVEAIFEKLREESFLKDIPDDVLSDIEAKVNRRSDEIDDKIHFITETLLLPSIKRLMLSLDDKVSPETRAEIIKTVQAMSEAIDALKPVVEIHENNLRKLARKVCLVTNDKKLETICKLALGGTGVQFNVISKNNFSEDVVPQILLIDFACLEQYQMLSQRYPDCEFVLVMGMDIVEILKVFKNFGKIKYFTTYDSTNRAFSIRSLATTVKKILQSDFFGMEKYLMWGTHIETRNLQGSDERLQLIQEMEKTCKENGVRTSILDRVHTVCEELLMNSVYAAPRDTEGKALYNHLSRDVVVELDPIHQPEFKFATDGTVLAVSVSDPFGGLSKELVEMYLTSCYDGLAGTYNDDKGGAGRGLHMIVESADYTVFNIKAGVQTEIICFFYIEKTEAIGSKSTINFFQI